MDSGIGFDGTMASGMCAMTDQTKKIAVHIRYLIQRDMPAVLAIEGYTMQFIARESGRPLEPANRITEWSGE